MDDVPQAADRRRVMNALAIAPCELLAQAWEPLDTKLRPVSLREPEVGLVMLRGRVGGGGAAFNLGEASVTRASVRLACGAIGHAMVLGRDPEKARLAACLDAAWQSGPHREAIEAGVVAPSLAAKADRDRRRAAETAATKVDFFTLVRGDD